MKKKLLLALLIAGFPVAAAADVTAPFRFTVTADNRGERPEFRHVLSEIKRRVGDEGVFHVSVGDIDPVKDTWADLVKAFGDGLRWHPVVGNHEVESRRDLEFLGAHGERLSMPRRPGPGGVPTTYSFEHHGAHFVVLDQFRDREGNFRGPGGMNDLLYGWLEEDLASARGPIFVFGHLPAYPRITHVGDSLDRNPAHRDRFWALLERHGVVAYVTAHTHYYSRHRPAGSRVWQIDAGNAGRMRGCEPLTFVDVAVEDDRVTFTAWQGRKGQEFTPRDEWIVPLDPDGTVARAEAALSEALTIAPVQADCTACRAGPAEGAGAALVLLPWILLRVRAARRARA